MSKQPEKFVFYAGPREMKAICNSMGREFADRVETENMIYQVAYPLPLEN